MLKHVDKLATQYKQVEKCQTFVAAVAIASLELGGLLPLVAVICGYPYVELITLRMREEEESE